MNDAEMLQMLKVTITDARKQGIGVGMVIAAAIVAGHDDVYAEEILNAAGISSIADMRQIGCDNYDIDKLRDIVKNIQRKEKLRKQRLSA